MGKRIYFSDYELEILECCVLNVDTADYAEGDPERVTLEKLYEKIGKAQVTE